MEPKDAAELAEVVDRARRQFATSISGQSTATEGKMATAIAEHVSAQIQLFAGILRETLYESAS